MQIAHKNYYSKSFNFYDASLCIGYRRKIFSKIAVTVIANYGLKDIKKNSFFAQPAFERNTGLKLVLTYNFFNF
jgi:hypothetical protein